MDHETNMPSWWDSPEHRDTASYVIAGVIGAAVASAANLFKQWPRDNWVRGLGTWLSSMTAGGLVFALGAEPLQNHPWPLIALVISAAWLGWRVLDRLAFKALGIKNGEREMNP